MCVTSEGGARERVEKGSERESVEKFCLERKLIGILIIYEKRNFSENGDEKSKCKKQEAIKHLRNLLIIEKCFSRRK